jgi:hypothetical protein
VSSEKQDAERWRVARECPKVWAAFGATTPEAAETIIDAAIEHMKKKENANG